MTAFEQISRNIAVNFLQNVVIIDDEIELQNQDQVSTEAVASKMVQAPIGRGRNAGGQTDDVSENNQTLEADQNVQTDTGIPHPISLNITNMFAKEGILCSMLKPEKADQNFETDNQNALKKADIVILDWKMFKEGANNDARVKNIIKSIVDNEQRHKQKSLRYIVIYSGEHRLLENHIYSVKNWVDEITTTEGIIEGEHNHYLNYEHLKFCFYAKPNLHNTNISAIHRSEDQLVKTVIDDFSQHVQGIAPQLALKSLTEIRENTHRVLHKFSKFLDPGYLTHRAMLSNPKEAEEQFVDLLTHELKSILEDTNIELEDSTIKGWVDTQIGKLDSVTLTALLKKTFFNEEFYETFNKAESQLSFLQHKGLSDIIEKKNGSEKPEFKFKDDGYLEPFITEHYQKLSEKHAKGTYTGIVNGICKATLPDNIRSYIHDNPTYFSEILPHDISNSNDLFSLVSTTRTYYNSPKPHLTLGSILKNGSYYYLCISPRCDTARVKYFEIDEGTDEIIMHNKQKMTEQGTYFQLIPLQLNSDSYEIIIELEDKTSIKFEVKYSPRLLKSVLFRQLRGHNQKPLRVNDNNAFIDIEKNEYQWLGELKNDKAQRILNQFAAQLSRVGINESEVLRRSYQ